MTDGSDFAKDFRSLSPEGRALYRLLYRTIKEHAEGISIISAQLRGMGAPPAAEVLSRERQEREHRKKAYDDVLQGRVSERTRNALTRQSSRWTVDEALNAVAQGVKIHNLGAKGLAELRRSGLLPTSDREVGV